MDEVFGTGRVARICGVAARTASKWIDSGKLPGYRIPGSGDRRVRRADLVAFLQANAMPLGELAHDGRPQLLFIGGDLRLAGRLQELLPGYRHQLAGSAFAAGLVLAHLAVPEVVVVDAGIGRPEALQVLRELRGRWAQLVLVALANEDDGHTGELVLAGAELIFRKPFDPALLLERLERERAIRLAAQVRPRSPRQPRALRQPAPLA